MKLSRLKSQMLTLRMPSASVIHWYCGLRSRYSLVRSACVTPSCESTIGHAKSYVGYTFHFELGPE